MKLITDHRFSGRRILWTNKNRMLSAQGMSFYTMDIQGRREGPRYWVGSLLERVISSVRLTRQGLRTGIHHLWPLPDGSYLVVIRKRTIHVQKDGTSRQVLSFPRGNKPAHKGVCVTPAGTVFVGEYALNFDRTLPVLLYRSMDNAKTFQTIHTFEPGKVRHIHFVQWDPLGSASGWARETPTKNV